MTRRTFRSHQRVSAVVRCFSALTAVACVVLVDVGLSARLRASGEAGIAIGSQVQPFVDDHLIGKADNVRRVAHEAQKYFPNPVLTYTRPWEGHSVIAWGSVIYDEEEKLFKAWYEAFQHTAPDDEQTLLCYATSRDGIYWDKPILNLVEFRGSRANNIVFRPPAPFDSAVIIKDLVDPDPQRRYKMMYYLAGPDRSKRGLYGATSHDGISWRLNPDRLVNAGDRSAFFFNPWRKTYTVLSRPGTPAPGTGVHRWVGLWESPDFGRFGAMQPAIWPDDADGKGTEFYSLQPFVYESVALGYLEMYYAGEQDRRFRRLDTQLAVSHDGIKWDRALNRTTFLKYGPIGAWDGAWVCPTSNPPIRVNDTLYIYYQGRRTFHWATKPRPFEQDGEVYQMNDPAFGHIGSVGLAFLRVDGFASMNAGSRLGTLTTKPLLLPTGKNLYVNAKVDGHLRVAVLDESGRPVDGFQAARCNDVTGDSLAHEVVWQGGKRLHQSGLKTVRLGFEMQNTALYSFTVR